MADQQPWLKLWTTALDDPHLEALSLENWARWARLALVVKRHGNAGTIVSRTPHRTLVGALRTRLRGLYDGVPVTRIVEVVRSLPGVLVEIPADDPDALIITFKNWSKYQYGSSTHRTRRWRDKQRSGDDTIASQERSGDAFPERKNASRVTVQEKIREEPPISPTQTNGSRAYPPEAFNLDCPDPRWRSRCVATSYAHSHPGAYPSSDSSGTPKQCPHHRKA